ncbi:type I restriction endonuclease subunit R [Spirochaetia bacterium]|nr:type I restriction endonuclease subunit R [Spirochaetia bacterium]
MTDSELKEKQFEADIESSLLSSGGYTKGNPKQFDRKRALDTSTFISFIQTTQPKQWQKYAAIYGNDSAESLINRFCKEVKQIGLLKVLRTGLRDRGIQFNFVYWKPETGINETTAALYNSNIFHCTRQLHYSVLNENSIDIVLFLNGIPVVSMELKDQFAGQNVDNAIRQYKFDRASKDAIFEFKNRVLVHFAVDLSDVYMTTRLLGEKTYFMPFNQGSNGAGNVGGKGNPPNPNGYQTSYLWEQALQKDSLLEILHKYMHLQIEERIDFKTKAKDIKETMIFPRYHQLDAVAKLLKEVKADGPGHNYLIQHSAESGKSNSIAWLAHRLSGLHDAQDNKIFNSVIVVTDRRVLDSQLQDTVYQFDHVEGVVKKIDKDSAQLRDAINANTPIIISTLQKFPVIFNTVNGNNKSFAVIVDEAHSSQHGNAAKKLKEALADTEEILAEYAKMENDAENAIPDEDEKIVNELATQGQQKNLSFFAFTATPKEKTLQMFGTKGVDGKYRAFHIYSMRQAIEEKFILDVLQNYMTYNMYYKIIKNIPDDPTLDTDRGIKAIKKYQTLHPHNIAQKAEIMIEHFRANTMRQIGGIEPKVRAKAMVVTASRLHAVRYCLEFRKQITMKGYTDISALVAFSDEIKDGKETYTEESLNKTSKGETIKQDQLRSYFHTDDYNVLIVAEKYQTGFDEPYLHTMFVDKNLSGVKAVQTLSRVNRTMQGKNSTFILDFVNTAEDMKKSFEPYYEAAILEEETDPNVLYQLKNTLDGYRVYSNNEVQRFADVFYHSDEKIAVGLPAQGILAQVLTPAIDRYKALDRETKDIFSKTLSRFVRIYSFVTQVYRMFDKDLHKFSQYAKFLLKFLPTKDVDRVSVDDKILMEYYRLEKNFDGSIALKSTETGFSPIKGEAGAKKEKKETLSKIIDDVNKRFGTNFTEQDKILEQMQNDFVKDPKWSGFAASNDYSTFRLLAKKGFKDIAAQRYVENDSFFMRIFDDTEFGEYIMDRFIERLYDKLKEGYTGTPGDFGAGMAAEPN